MTRYATKAFAFPCLLLVAFVLAPAASADVPILNFGIKPNNTQAGSHPDLQVTFALEDSEQQQKKPGGPNSPCACENPRIIVVHSPPGLVGNPHATPRCSAADFGSTSCPVDSQIGFVNGAVAFSPDYSLSFNAPLYNLEPHADEPGLAGFQVLGSTVFEKLSSRTGSDYGLDTTVYVPSLFPVRLINQIFFGVPALPSNDRLRFKFPGISTFADAVCDTEGRPVSPTLILTRHDLDNPTGPLSGPDSFQKECFGLGEDFNHQVPATSSSPETAFIEAPTTCGDALEATIDVTAYDGGVTHSAAQYPTTGGCDQLAFNPSLAAKPTTAEADSPSGVDVDLTVPQTQSPSSPSPSEIRAATVTLPKGFSINANAADGKTSCDEVEAKFGSEDRGTCPEYAKVGTLTLHTALLPGPLPGYVYLGKPLPGERYRLFLVADGFGVHIKLRGTVTPDPVTGQVMFSFNNLPQTPFEQFKLHIFGSERGTLATPTECGTYAVHSTFTPWDGALPDQSATQFFTIDSGPGGAPCPSSGSRPFGPSFSASSTSNTAGAHSAFAVDLTRADGDQYLSGLEVRTPPGITATLKGIPYCSDGAIALMEGADYAGLQELGVSACPSDSLVGTAIAAAGAGSKPVFTSGKVYLSGPYKGAPLSLVIVVPAVSGPYDLGNVVVRVALAIDPVTAQVTAISDPLPQIIGGIPLRTRQVRVLLDRNDFALNPTNCDPLAVDATIFGDQGAVVARSARYQVANCATLPYRPKLSLRLTGGLNRRGHPAIHAVLRARDGEANTKRVSVTLPQGELLDNSHIKTICTRVKFAAQACPPGSLIGRAKAVTPLLDEPLSGNVYLRSSHHQLPDIAVDLRGQFHVELAGRVDSIPGRLRTTFESAPDVPVTRFEIDLKGGSRGLVQNSESLCGRSTHASVVMAGQNGVKVTRRTMLQAKCGPSNSRKGA